jgi:hypothetical protein
MKARGLLSEHRDGVSLMLVQEMLGENYPTSRITVSAES